MQKLFTKREDVDILKESGADLIGYGALSQVRKARLRSTGKIYALKEMDLKMIHPNDIKNIQREIKTQMYLDHPNIVHLYDSIHTPDNVLLLLLEYADNNSLFNYIQGRPIDDKLIHKFFFQTVQAIEYIHKRKIMHRDLKPENILLDKNYNVKVCDFGWCAEYNEQERRQTFCGTSEYMAPEIIDSKAQDPSIDIWSLGILLYEMYHKKAPYRGTNPHEILKDIKRKRLTFTEPRMSQEARDMVEKILVVDPKRRISLEEMYKHPYFFKFPFFKLDTPDPKQVKSARRSYVGSPKGKPSTFDFKAENSNANKPTDKPQGAKPAFGSTDASNGFNLIKVIPANSPSEAGKPTLGGTYSDSSQVLPSTNNTIGQNTSGAYKQTHQHTVVQSSVQGNQLSQSLVFQGYSNGNQQNTGTMTYNLPSMVTTTSIQSPASIMLPPNPNSSNQTQSTANTSQTLISSNYGNFGNISHQPMTSTSITLPSMVRQEQQTFGTLNHSMNLSQPRISNQDPFSMNIDGDSHSRKLVEYEERNTLNGTIRRVSNPGNGAVATQQSNVAPRAWRPLTGPWQPPTYAQSTNQDQREGTITKKTYDAPSYTTSVGQNGWSNRPTNSTGNTTISSGINSQGQTVTTTTTSTVGPSQPTTLLSSSSTLTNYTQLVSQGAVIQQSSYPSVSIPSYGQPPQRTPPTSFTHSNSYFVQQSQAKPVLNTQQVLNPTQSYNVIQGQTLYPQTTTITSGASTHYAPQLTSFYQPSQLSQVSRAPTSLLPTSTWTRPTQQPGTTVMAPQQPTYVLSQQQAPTTYSVIQR